MLPIGNYLSFYILRTMVPYSRNGLQNGLTLIVDAESFDYSISATHGEGFVISPMHHVREQ